MAVSETQSQEQNGNGDSSAKQSDKELNFRVLQAKYEKRLQEEMKAREIAESKLQELSSRNLAVDDDTDDEEYVDHKKLEKKLAKFGEKNKHETQSQIQAAVQMALNEERKNNWIKQNPDFFDVLQKHAEKLALKDPELADTILEMPEGFERQKLVYKNIKALGLHKESPKEPSIQEKIDSNRKSPYYQPSGIGTAPYSQVGDFSQSGKKQAFDKMQELKARLRLS
jgi:hypothetical protein